MPRRTIPLVLALLGLALPAAASDPADSDRQALLEHLERTRDLFTAAVAGLTPEQATWRAAADRWSIAEVAEHLAASEDFIRRTIAGLLEAEPAAEPPADAAKDEQVLALIVDRSQKFQAPEPLAPQGRWENLAATMAHFADSRATTIRLVGDGTGLRTRASEHPAFGNLDAVGWVYFLSGHTERHTLQIEEVKASPGFPSG